MAGEFVMSRVFDAPRDLVWTCFTDPERMKEWWGPKGFKVLAAKIDLRPGGMYHYGMQAPTGQTMWGKFVFREIVPQELMVFIRLVSHQKRAASRATPETKTGHSNCFRHSRSKMSPAEKQNSPSPGHRTTHPKTNARPSMQIVKAWSRAGAARWKQSEAYLARTK